MTRYSWTAHALAHGFHVHTCTTSVVGPGGVATWPPSQAHLHQMWPHLWTGVFRVWAAAQTCPATVHMAKAWHPGGSPVRGPLPSRSVVGLRPGFLYVHHVLREVQPGGPRPQHAGGEAPVCPRQGRPRARPHFVQGLVPGRGGPRARLPLPGLPGQGWPLLLCSRAAGPCFRSLEGRPGWGHRPLGGLLEACPAPVAGGLPCMVGPALPVAVGPAALAVGLGGPLLLGRGLLVLLVKGGPVLVQRGLRGLLLLRRRPLLRL